MLKIECPCNNIDKCRITSLFLGILLIIIGTQNGLNYNKTEQIYYISVTSIILGIILSIYSFVKCNDYESL